MHVQLALQPPSKPTNLAMPCRHHVCMQASLAFVASLCPAPLAMPLPSFHSGAECLVNQLFAVSSAMGQARQVKAARLMH